MDNVKYCVIAVRNLNKNTKDQKDFETVLRFIDTIYTSQKLKLPLSVFWFLATKTRFPIAHSNLNLSFNFNISWATFLSVIVA